MADTKLCPKCGRVPRMMYPGGDPEEGPARLECPPCGWDEDSAWYEKAVEAWRDVAAIPGAFVDLDAEPLPAALEACARHGVAWDVVRDMEAEDRSLGRLYACEHDVPYGCDACNGS